MNTILAIEASTCQISAALYDPNEELEAIWSSIPDRRKPAALLSGVLGLLDERNITFDQIGCIAVGRGPGIYSGLRESLTAAQALALPTKIPLYPLNSGLILATHALSETENSSVIIAGDARRSQFWYARFDQRGIDIEQQDKWKLAGRDELLHEVQNCGFSVSSEWDRIKNVCQNHEHPEGLESFLHENMYPSALTLAQIAYDRLQQGVSAEKAAPIYMHPAVVARHKG